MALTVRMSLSATFAVSALTLALLGSAAPSAFGQVAAAPPDNVAAKAATEPAASTSAPDPLTPKAAEPTPIIAPGAPAPSEKVAISAPRDADAIVSVVRRVLEPASAATGTGEAADRAALAAFYRDGNGKSLWASTQGLTPHGKAAIAEMQRAADFGLEPAAFAGGTDLAAGASPDAAAAVEIRIGMAVLKYARHARGGRVNPTAISPNMDRQPRLYEPKSVIEAIATAAEPDAYLRDLHPQHKGFRRLQKALVQARSEAGSKSDTIQRLIVNMERWRWMPDDLGEFHVLDNIPEQLTRVYKNDKVVLTERIVVGKPQHQTPEFSAPMKFVIFHPTWGVPDGIKTNEIAPMLRRASARNSGGMDWLFGGGNGGVVSRSLARHELVVTQNGRPVNPDSIDWNRVDVRQFQFTQPASGKNVLGIVKFRFPNKFDVYMHDTQDKHLFSHATRAYSHGCMRVQNPLKFAEVILGYDKGWTADRIQSLVARGATSDITLDKNVPVHIVYFTASVDEDGKLKTFSDLYGRDARIASALAGRPVAIASVAAPAAEKQAAAPGGESVAKRGEKRTVVQRTKAGSQESGFNPFGFISSN